MGLFSSKKKEVYNNGWYYGEFNFNGKRHGYGEYHWDSGNWYRGEFRNGVRTGYGEYHYYNGDWYEGPFLDGKFEGEGKYHWASGELYIGHFSNDIMSGEATYYYTDGAIIIGRFRNDEPDYGTFYWSANKYCRGYFRDWHLHGECIYTKDGVSRNCLYDNGKFVRFL